MIVVQKLELTRVVSAVLGRACAVCAVRERGCVVSAFLGRAFVVSAREICAVSTVRVGVTRLPSMMTDSHLVVVAGGNSQRHQRKQNCGRKGDHCRKTLWGLAALRLYRYI